LIKRYYSSKRATLGFAIGIILVILLSACSFPGVASTSARLPLVSEKPTAQALPPIRFPQDEGAHDDLTEWWYYTGHLQGSDAAGNTHQYGFELVIFQAQRSTLPTVYPAHFAISDITRGEFHYDQRRVSRVTAGTAGTRADRGKPSPYGIDLHVGDWSIQGLNGHDHLAAEMQDYALDLDLVGQKPAVLHGDNGVITMGLAGFSYYYSRTHMDVQGIIIDHSQAVRVTGLAWMDHQWGNFVLLNGGGWDWYSIQLSNDTEMMLYFIRDASGQITPSVSYSDASGKASVIAPGEVRTTVLGTWKSQTTGISYSSGWQLAVNDPQLQATLMLKPLLNDQELVVKESTGSIYWEGAVAIEGQSNGQAIHGQGYVELLQYPPSVL
jgi:predicted secreted hydrolase